ncbi:MAG TPA: hypothetical protein VGF95_15830 [Solirubrobacteraceae bacterium]|jgi:hypothetical protein
MSIGTSILLLAVGAILRFAVSVTTTGFSIHTVGVILMIAGAVGLVLSLLWLAVWSDRRRERPEAVIRERERY